MDATKKAMWQKVLAHQLEGIMFHGEAAMIYDLMGDCNFRKREHIYRYLTELMNHFTTGSKLIKEYGEIIRPLPNSVHKVKIFDPEVVTRPAEKAERENIAKHICDKWRSWEESTVKMYEEAATVIPDCTWLKKLHRDTEREYARIRP